MCGPKLVITVFVAPATPTAPDTFIFEGTADRLRGEIGHDGSLAIKHRIDRDKVVETTFAAGKWDRVQYAETKAAS